MYENLKHEKQIKQKGNYAKRTNTRTNTATTDSCSTNISQSGLAVLINLYVKWKYTFKKIAIFATGVKSGPPMIIAEKYGIILRLA